MEKQHKRNGSKILKAVIAVSMTFHNTPFSPGRDHHKSRTDQNNATTKWVKPHHHGGNKGFSGPMIPRTNLKDGGFENYNREPTSPKISCMGQIKHKKNQIKKSKSKKSVSLQNETRKFASTTNKTTTTSTSNSTDVIEVKKKNVASKFQRMLFHATKQPKSAGRKSDASSAEREAPHMSQMKRFSSGRDAFSSFDWKAEMAAEEIQIDDYYSDEDRVVESDGDEEEERIIIPFSAPMLIGGGAGGGCVAHGDVLNLKPRKEINLWKRRTMAPPRPLQLDP